MEKKNKKVDHAKACRKLYEDIGPSAVYDYATKHKLTESRYCRPCETDTPTHNNCCLLCGTDNSLEIINAAVSNLPTAGIRLHNTGAKEPIEFVFGINTDPNYPGLKLTVNGQTAVILEYDSVMEAIRIHTYADKADEPVSSVYKQFKKTNGKS